MDRKCCQTRDQSYIMAKDFIYWDFNTMLVAGLTELMVASLSPSSCLCLAIMSLISSSFMIFSFSRSEYCSSAMERASCSESALVKLASSWAVRESLWREGRSCYQCIIKMLEPDTFFNYRLIQLKGQILCEMNSQREINTKSVIWKRKTCSGCAADASLPFKASTDQFFCFSFIHRTMLVLHALQFASSNLI